MKDLKPLLVFAAFIAVILAVSIIIAYLLASRVNRDNPHAFDDSDLRLTRVEVPTESNAFGMLLELTNKLYWPESQETKLNDLSASTNWEDSLAAEVLDKNQACLDSFDRAMQRPFLQVPEPDRFDDDLSYLGSWKNISRAKAIQAGILFRAKQEPAAFNEAFEIIGFGQRVEGSGGGVIHYFLGASIKAVGLLQIRHMTAQTSLSYARLADFIHELDGFKPDKPGLTNAVKVAYKSMCNYLDDFAAGRIPSVTNSASERTMISFGLRSFLDKTKTKMKFARASRVVLAGVSNPYGEIDWSNWPIVETNRSFLSTLKRTIKGNAMGDIWFEMLGPSIKPILSRKSRENVELTATQLLLALKIYKMRHDKLPETLSELVPDELPQIPMDDYDGKPFHYVPDKKLIYSVGSDLKDDGGKGYHKYSESYDIPFRIEF